MDEILVEKVKPGSGFAPDYSVPYNNELNGMPGNALLPDLEYPGRWLLPELAYLEWIFRVDSG
jgi:hypothetical protein